MRTPFHQRSRAALAVLAIVTLAVAVWALADQRAEEPEAGSHRYAYLATTGEIALGRVLGDLVAKRHGGPSTDAVLAERVDRLARGLADGTLASTTLFDFEIEVLADTEEPAVYAMPGGRILVTAALVELFDDDDELAAVLAEQIGLVIHSVPTHALDEAGLLEPLPTVAALEELDTDAVDPAQRAVLEAAADCMGSCTYPHERELRAERTALELLGQGPFDASAAERAAQTRGSRQIAGTRFETAKHLQLIEDARAANQAESG